MYEVFTEKVPYKDMGLNYKSVIEKIVHEDLRPDTSNLPYPINNILIIVIILILIDFEKT